MEKHFNKMGISIHINNIAILTDNDVFYKQIYQLLQKAKEDGFDITAVMRLYNGDYLGNSIIIISDGIDERVDIDAEAPVFIICNPEIYDKYCYTKSITHMLYKNTSFSPEKLLNDIGTWYWMQMENIEVRKTNKKLEKQINNLNNELNEYKLALDTAGTIQTDTYSLYASNTFDIAIHYQPKAIVSGDILIYYELFDKIYIVIGDVTDHGYQAGLYGASLTAIIRSYLLLASEFSLTLDGLVNFVRKSSHFVNLEAHNFKSAENATMLFCEINKTTHKISFYNCGHGGEAPIITRKTGETFIVNNIFIDPPIGSIDEENNIVTKNKIYTLDFDPGDGIVLYTDGITEIFSIGDNEHKDTVNIYNNDRLEAGIKYEIDKHSYTARSILNGIIKDAESYSIGINLNDDLSATNVENAADDITVGVFIWKNE